MFGFENTVPVRSLPRANASDVNSIFLRGINIKKILPWSREAVVFVFEERGKESPPRLGAYKVPWTFYKVQPWWFSLQYNSTTERTFVWICMNYESRFRTCDGREGQISSSRHDSMVFG